MHMVGIFIGISINSTKAIIVCSRAQNNRLSLAGHIFLPDSVYEWTKSKMVGHNTVHFKEWGAIDNTVPLSNKWPTNFKCLFWALHVMPCTCYTCNYLVDTCGRRYLKKACLYWTRQKKITKTLVNHIVSHCLSTDHCNVSSHTGHIYNSG